MRKLLISAVVVVVAGCAISPARIASQTDMEICKSYAIYSPGPGFGALADQYKEELVRRNLLTEEEWALAAQKRVQIGMSRCAMYVSLGKPDHENRSVGSWGVRMQHVYNSGYRYIRASYVYTDNGKVSSWQD